MNIVFGKNGFVGSNLEMDCLAPNKKECNLLKYNSVKKYLSKFKNKEITIINLAAKVAGVIYNKNHNVEMMYENTLMSLNLIKAIKELNIKCYYLTISSVCAYDSNFEIDENNLFNSVPQNSNFGYGISKRISFFSARALKLDDPNFKFGCLIPTNMYGPNDEIDLKYAHVIPSLFIKILDKNNKNLEVYGNCLAERNFLYVKDLCKSIEFFAENKIEGYFNISSDEQISIKDLTEKIKKTTNSKKDINYSYTGEFEKRKVKNQKIKDLYLKFNSKLVFTTLDDGLKNTFNWIKNLNK